ncbi:MAG: Rieske (2Fe-2S) protein [Ignavibacteria bacterium]|nr:Rieske (2Fe-2S) protein [Ignavibacteria bacterium]
MHHENENDTNLPNEVQVGSARRRWMKSVIALTIAAPFAVMSSLFTSTTEVHYSTSISLGNVDELFATRNWRELTVQKQRVLAIKTETGISVLLLKCTHAGCPLKVETNNIVCDCHGGTFSMNGQPVSGPPKLPLVALESRVTDGTLYTRIFGGG